MSGGPDPRLPRNRRRPRRQPSPGAVEAEGEDNGACGEDVETEEAGWACAPPGGAEGHLEEGEVRELVEEAEGLGPARRRATARM